jgi:hypothetical protein
MWEKIKRAFVAFKMYAEALLALPLVVSSVIGIWALRGKSDNGGPVLVGLALLAFGMWATYKTLGRLGWIAHR